jgi:TolB-like protein
LLYSFEDYVLDVGRRELRRDGHQVSVEPQVFDLLHHLLRNRNRVVTKDELLAAVWGGRIVSESALTSRINAARSAVGDTGEGQRLVRTLRGRGFRFVGAVREEEAAENIARSAAAAQQHAAATAPPPVSDTTTDSDYNPIVGTETRRASVAIMPFVDRSPTPGGRGGTAEGLAHDVITRLAKLRSLFVIAQGTVFALHERNIGPQEAARMLNVDYLVSGSVRHDGNRLTVEIELAETQTARIVWAEVFQQKFDDALLVLDEIGNRVVASIASEIETHERNRAILRPPNSLDAWQAHHRGLWHVYRFNRPDNERAQHLFEAAVRLDPTFARAHAGLSFTHWQNAFQGWSERQPAMQRAYEAAGQSLMADDRDPAAHLAMGRALWLRGSHDQALSELERAVDLSPNFALGHYTLAFVHSQDGDPAAALRYSDHSRHLSPFDPLIFAMLGARSMAMVRLRKFEEAADWGVKAASRPNAHAHIFAIAAYSLALAGRLDEGRAHMAHIRKQIPHYRVDDFLTAMQFDAPGTKLFREAAKKIDS